MKPRHDRVRGPAPTLARRLLLSGGSLLPVALIALLPHALGTTWSGVGAVLGALPVVVLGGLVALWVLGLMIHLPVLRASLPGLTAVRALRLNLAGSAISNVLPAGGAAGAGLGFAMTRSWGFTREEFASFAIISNAWNSLGRLVVGLAVVGAASRLGVPLPQGATSTADTALGLLAGVAVVAWFALRTEGAARSLGQVLDRVVRLVPSRVVPPRVVPPRAVDPQPHWLVEGRRQVIEAVRDRWIRLSVFVLAYLVAQALLLGACLAAVHAHASIGAVAVAFALERLITLVPVTPGAAGVAELGAVGALHVLGIDPAVAAAGVLLYRSMIFAAEIPVGGAVALHWWHTDRRSRERGVVVAMRRRGTEASAA